jgi:preprotein translocase subunit SecD
MLRSIACSDRWGAAVAIGVIFLALAGCGGAGQGSVELTFRSNDAVQTDAPIVRARLQRLGVAHATVADRDGRLVVRAPGVQADGADALARQLAGASPLRFYDWEANVVGPRCRIDPANTEVTGGEHAGGPASGLDASAARERAARCPGTIVVRARGLDTDRWYVLRDRPAVTGAQIRDPSPFLDDGEAKVTFDFTPAGVRAWQRLTKAVAARDRRAASAGGDPQHVAVVLDDALLSTPSVAYSDHPDGIDASFGSQIDGGLTLRSAEAVARAVRAGTLPAPLALDHIRVVG